MIATVITRVILSHRFTLRTDRFDQRLGRQEKMRDELKNFNATSSRFPQSLEKTLESNEGPVSTATSVFLFAALVARNDDGDRRSAPFDFKDRLVWQDPSVDQSTIVG